MQFRILMTKDWNSYDIIGEEPAEGSEELEMVEGVYDAFDREAYLSGEVAPVFFGSAIKITSQVLKELLDTFCEIITWSCYRFETD